MPFAAAAVGAEPVFVNATAETGHLPDFAGLDSATLDSAAICYLCSPANPQGAKPEAARATPIAEVPTDALQFGVRVLRRFLAAS